MPTEDVPLTKVKRLCVSGQVVVKRTMIICINRHVPISLSVCLSVCLSVSLSLSLSHTHTHTHTRTHTHTFEFPLYRARAYVCVSVRVLYLLSSVSASLSGHYLFFVTLLTQPPSVPQRDPISISTPRIVRVFFVVSFFVCLSVCLFNLPRPAVSVPLL